MIKKFSVIPFAIILNLLSLSLIAQNSTKTKPKDNEAIPTKNKTSVKLIEYIVGTWKINDGNNASEKNKSSLGQTLDFNREGRFVARSGNEKIDSGAYRLNENQGILYLESASGGKPTEWSIWFKKNIMNLQQKNNSTPGNIKYAYLRVAGNKAGQ